MFGFRPEELIIVLLILLLIFGAKRLPELARSFSQSIRQFRKGMKELQAPEDEKKTLDPAKNDQQILESDIASKKATSIPQEIATSVVDKQP
jgi:sec-independent protein translocase protein TatA